MGPVLVVEGLVFAERVQEVGLVEDQVRSRSSALQDRTQRSMIAFMRGTRIPVLTMAMPSPSKTLSNARVYLLSRSRIRYFIVTPASCRSMTRFLASCVVQAAVGWAVVPMMWMRRVACSMMAKTYSRAPVRVRVSKKSAARIACAWLRRKCRGLGGFPRRWRGRP